MFLARLPLRLAPCRSLAVCCSRPLSAAMATHASLNFKPDSSLVESRYIDIGINLTDPVFKGYYNGIKRHDNDLNAVISRARQVGCSKLIVTGSDIESTGDAFKLAAEYPGIVYATAGIHPCNSSIFSTHGRHGEENDEASRDLGPSTHPFMHDRPYPPKTEAIIGELTALIAEARSPDQKRLVALGEIGLDYDRLFFCSKTVQLHSFAAQLQLAASLSPQLPLFLHSRAAHSDFVSELKKAFGSKLERLNKGGVVHSFTGTVEELNELMELGLYIGINGCSLKTVNNCATVKEVSLDRIMLETDGPWCEVRPSHKGLKILKQQRPVEESTSSGPIKKLDLLQMFEVVKKEKWKKGAMVKSRNEPCQIELVAQIVAAIKGISVKQVREAALSNTVRVFGLEETS